MSMSIPIIIHDPELPIPEHKEWGDWVDLRSAETVEMKQGEFRIISLGVSMKLPDGYEAHVAPRSSTFKNFGILSVNSIGWRTATASSTTPTAATMTSGASRPSP